MMNKLNALVGLGVGVVVTGGLYYIMTRDKEVETVVTNNDDIDSLQFAKVKAIDFMNKFKSITSDAILIDFVIRIDKCGTVDEIKETTEQFIRYNSFGVK